METLGEFPLNGTMPEQSGLTKSIWDDTLDSSAGSTGVLGAIRSAIPSREAFKSGLDLLSTSNLQLNPPPDQLETVSRAAPANALDSYNLFPQSKFLQTAASLQDLNQEPEDESEEVGGIRLRDPLTGLAEPVLGIEVDGDIFLDFSSSNSGLKDQDGQGIGFTSVQSNEDDSQAELYDDDRVDLDTTAGTLSLTVPPESNATTNTLENALQLPIAATQPFTISARLINLPTTTTAAQLGGIFLGSSQDDYVKLALVGSNGDLGLQFFQEQSGEGSNVGGDSGLQIRELDPSNIETLDLFLTGDPATGIIKAAYRINSDTATPTSLIQEFEPSSPETFFADKSTAHAGILPTVTTSDVTAPSESSPDSDPGDESTAQFGITALAAVEDGPAYDSFGIEYAAAAATQDIKINFQPNTATVPAGYSKDTGQAYSNTRGFGWVRQDSLSSATHVPLDITPNTRDRNRSGVDQRLDTLIHLQGNNIPNFTGVKTPAAWEYTLPNGYYSVVVSVGDQPDSGTSYTAQHRIRVEGVEAIRPFKGSSIHEYELGTTQVNVADGRLSIDAIGGTNTKINYVEIKGISPGEQPSISGSSPISRQKGIGRNAAINLDVDLATTEAGVNATTLNTDNIQLYRTRDNKLVDGNINTTGGGDAIVYQPKTPLDASTHYTLRLSDGVRDQAGNSFLPFSTTFSTGTAGIPGTPGVKFNKSTVYDGASISSLVINGNKLYAASLDGSLRRWTIGSTGTLSNLQTFDGLAGRSIIGIAFDPTNPNVLWVSHNDTIFVQPATDFTGKISKLTLQSGPSFNASIQDYVVGLPRSAKDHLSNSLVFGPDEDPGPAVRRYLYMTQGSNSAMGAPDSAWGPRGEQLLSAAVLQINPGLTPPTGGFNVRTQGRGTANYNPYATNAPVKIYATGVRNAYDLAWHSNGSLYVPTNGSAAGGNTPDNPGTSADEGLTNVATQNDYLFKVAQGGYYGHPNPKRNEYIMNGGNPTSGKDPAEVVAVTETVNGKVVSREGYPVGTQPQQNPNYRGFAYDFGRNRSPNGVIEYRSNTFGGALKNQLLVVEYSGGDDILALKPGTNGNIPSSGVTQVAAAFTNPLDLIEDTSSTTSRNGNVYVAELIDEIAGKGRITLLKPA